MKEEERQVLLNTTKELFDLKKTFYLSIGNFPAAYKVILEKAIVLGRLSSNSEENN